MCDKETEQQEIQEIRNITVPDEVLHVHGYAPPKKADGTVRLIYENVNGFQNRLSGNEKVERAKEIHDELEVDIVAYCEHQLNMKHKKNSNGFNCLFKGGKPLYGPSLHTMYMKTLVGRNKGERASFFSGI